MSTREDKISLLSEMIAFAIVDGELHDYEYDFLLLVSTELQIEKETFLDLFRKRDELTVIKDEFTRILHFYRLALLMHVDEVLHENEIIAIKEIGIKMGLNPAAMKKILQIMKESPNQIIEPQILITAFQEQLN
ncbi:excinuclease ABC subunit B [Flavobacterium sp. GT3R68]|uniref:excinuclease ABC subunit B n=1 Tax=Flavobacterium sp. GT3R68 TaxID=2594437 RepID=UPI000F88380C|nr:excinuclease ABC subunit B [Flavobacterium sp. GT3R68]RTY95316.1 excinuclease ABC subunit B [Flavobacterium sp. GSN2]TRW90944.1 excinuclease ABC subunit B [Flavobacterium sp. GT3R68]